MSINVTFNFNKELKNKITPLQGVASVTTFWIKLV